MSFSLITAVYGVDKLHFIESLFNSIIKQKVDKVESIIVDQNKTDEVKELCEKYQERLNIKYVRVDKPGLSRARNAGLDHAKNEIIAFPDDDCEYPEGLLEQVHSFFDKNKYDFFIAGLRDTKNGNKLPYSSLHGEQEISITDVFKAANSNSIFHKNKYNVRFDEQLGIGAKYKSTEEFDYVLGIMKNGGKGYFNEEVYVFHPDYQNLDLQSMYKKIETNSIGHGAYFKKHFGLLWKSAIYYLIVAPIGGIILYSIQLNFIKAKIYFLLLKSRIKGFFTYSKMT